MRVNARLDDEDSKKIKFLTHTTGLNLSALLKNAIRALYESHASKFANSAMLLEKTGFIGCAKAENDLSRDYKKILSSTLEKKHDHR